tara:strand:+ start:2730 stop:3104 length:375 start_codon:yes stop_codon:yes gene_type:complete
MTRINTGIKPTELPDKLLLAELREIKRIPNVVKSGRYNLENVPETFRLGVGHVKFFYSRGAYTLNRYKELRLEALKRGFNVADFSGAWDNYPQELFNNYTPTEKARELLVHRIENERGFNLITQ